ncbi:MAG: molybdopterin molybdotransferase MoeA [Pyrinomonadaceae bacterium]
MISIEEALQIVESKVPLLYPGSEELRHARGRVLLEDIVADMDIPPFDRSQMDGFAVRASDLGTLPATLRIVGESVAGRGWDGDLKKGEAVRIMTGARVPNGADAVQIVEETESDDTGVIVKSSVRTGANIVPMGSETKKGGLIFEKGRVVTSNMIPALASFGVARISCRISPRVSILATGSEIVDIEKTPQKDQIRNSNSWMLAELAKNCRANAKILPIASDDLESLTELVRHELPLCDILIISGGVSVGDYDFTKPALENAGAEIHFEKVALKPGKPTVFATHGNKLIFGLPGNPVSAAVTFLVFARNSILRLQGASEARLAESKAVMNHDVKGAKGRDSLLPVTLSTDEKGTRLVETIRFGGSSNFVRFADANGLVFVARDVVVKKGEIATVYELPS